MSGSEIGFRTIHNILSDCKYVGYVDVGYLRKKDAKTFKKYVKRKLRVGQPFGARIFIDISKGGVKARELGREGLLEVVKAIKEKFESLEEKDIYLIELDAGQKNILGRASALYFLRPLV